MLCLIYCQKQNKLLRLNFFLFILPLMNKKTTGIVIAVVVLLLLVGGVWALHSRLQSSTDGEAATPQNQAQQMTTGKKSLADFLSMNATLKCTFSDKANSSSGTVYVSNGKMRGDFQSQDNGTATQTHMVNDSSYIYYWTDGQKNGYKMSLDVIKKETSNISMAPSNGSSQPGQPQGVNMNQQANYSCGPWVVNSSLFTVPSDVTFTDYSSMMQGAASQSSTSQQAPATAQGGTQMHGSAAMCSQCDKAPAGTARNQCLAALHC